MSKHGKDKLEVAQRKIFIGGLSYGTDDDKLRQYFQGYGAVQDAVVMKDPVSRRSRGFGFVTFAEPGSVDAALAREPHTIDGRKVEAKRAVPRAEGREPVSPSPTSKAPPDPSPDRGVPSSLAALDPRINMEELAYNKVFVGGLHYDTRDAEFRAYFERFGRVLSAEVMFNRETHKSRGFGFVVFEREAGAERVCAERELAIDGKVVEVKRAVPRAKLPQSPHTSASPQTSSTSSPLVVSRSEMRRTASVGSAPSGGLPPRTAKAQGSVSSPAGSGNSSTQRASYAAALSQGQTHGPYAVGGSSSMYTGLFDDARLPMPRSMRAQSEPTIQVVSLDSLIDDYMYMDPSLVDHSASFSTESLGDLGLGLGLPFARSRSTTSVGAGEELSRHSSFSSQVQGPIGSPSTHRYDVCDEGMGQGLGQGQGRAWMPSYLSASTVGETRLRAASDERPLTALLSLQQGRLDRHPVLPSPSAWASIVAAQDPYLLSPQRLSLDGAGMHMGLGGLFASEMDDSALRDTGGALRK